MPLVLTSLWFSLTLKVYFVKNVHLLMRRGLFVNVQRGLGKIDVWKEIVFLVNFGRWDLSCSSEGGGIHIRYTLGERNLSIVIYLDPESLFKPLFEIGSIEVLTDYMYGKSYLSWDTTKIKCKRQFYPENLRNMKKKCEFLELRN